MKKFLIIISLVLSGCMTARENTTNKLSSGPNILKVDGSGDQQDDLWTRRLEEAKKELTSKSDQDKNQADANFQLADRYYQEGKLHLAETECDKALMLNPKHAGAYALKQRILFVTNRAKLTIPQDFADKEKARRNQIYLEISNSLDRGYRLYNLSDYDNAEKEFNLVTLYSRQFPDDIDIQILYKRAMQMMTAVKDAKRQKEIDQRLLVKRKLDEQKRRDELDRLIQQQADIKVLLEKAKLHFDKQEYDNVIKLCEQVLELNPGLVRVRELKEISEKLQFEKIEGYLHELFIDEWKKNFREIERMLIVPDENQVIFFPSKEEWEKISKREPPVIKPTEKIDFKSKEVITKIRSQRIDIGFEGTPLEDFVKRLQELSDLNFHITKDVVRSTPITLPKASRITIDKVLELSLSNLSPALTFYVEDGIIYIATEEQALKRQMEERIYPLEELLYVPPNFPGNIFDPMNFIFSPPAAVQPQGINEDMIIDWILKFIDPKANKNNGEAGNPRSIRVQNRMLFVKNTKEMHEKILKFLNDFRSILQVLVSVEARFVTIEHSWVKRFGIELANLQTVAGIDPFARMPANFNIRTVADVPVGVAGSGGHRLRRDWGLVAVNALQVAAFTNAAGPDSDSRLEYMLVDDVVVNAILRMISKNKKGNIVTAPRLTLYNNQQSNLFLGSSRPINDPGFMLGMTGGPGQTNSGVSFDVRPLVSADRKYVTMNLSLSMARTSARTIDFQLPPPPPPPGIIGPPPPAQTIQFQLPQAEFVTLRTTAIVPDQGTLIVGGFSVNIDVDAESSIPIWRAVPVLGIVGTDQIDGRERHRLIVIAKAKIIVPTDEEKKRFGQ